MMKKQFPFVVLLLSLGTAALAETQPNIHQGPLENRVDSLAAIQPGLGVVMHEIGYRFSNMYWAATGGNWGLAQYQLKEVIEAQEVAEVTRPQRASMLKAFEENHLVPLGKAIERKDINQFRRGFATAVDACNGCHTALGYAFIRYRVPKQSAQEVLDFSLKTEPKYEEKAEPK